MIPLPSNKGRLWECGIVDNDRETHPDTQKGGQKGGPNRRTAAYCSFLSFAQVHLWPLLYASDLSFSILMMSPQSGIEASRRLVPKEVRSSRLELVTEYAMTVFI